MEISEAVEMLNKFKNSQNPTEKEIFACNLYFDCIYFKAWSQISLMSTDSTISTR